MTSHAVDTADIVRAGQTAIQFVQGLLAAEKVRDFRLEEVQESPDGRSWLITIGFLRPDMVQPLKYLAGVETHFRDHKVVTIDKERGIPTAMRNREDE